MADQQPRDPSQPKPEQDWNEVSVQEIEQTLSSASDLAYELAGNVGVAPDQPKFRDTSGLESIEAALDGELKQLEHLVDETRGQLNESPPPAVEKPGRAAPVPDFMAEFLSDEPVTVVPDPRAPTEAATEIRSSASQPESGSTPEKIQKVGLIGVGTLGSEPKKVPKPERPRPAEPAKPARRSIGTRLFEGPLYRCCNGTIGLLEVVNRPFAKLGPTAQRAISVTAIAAFCVCLAMFVLSLLMS